MQVRLSDGESDNSGRVEVRHKGVWGTVCDDHFGQDEAQVRMCYEKLKKKMESIFSIKSRGRGRRYATDINSNTYNRNIVIPEQENETKTVETDLSSTKINGYIVQKVIDNNNNNNHIIINNKEKYKWTKKNLVSQMEDVSENSDSECSICDRPTKTLFCKMCSSIFRVRI